jgi:hypothetical protein
VVGRREDEAAFAVAGDHRLEHRTPALGTMRTAGPQHAALEVAELVEDEQWMIAAAAEMVVPSRALLLPMGRALRMSRPPFRIRQAAAMSLIFIAGSAQDVCYRPQHLGNADFMGVLKSPGGAGAGTGQQHGCEGNLLSAREFSISIPNLEFRPAACARCSFCRLSLTYS